MHAAKTQISLGGCLGWSESSMGAHLVLLVLSCSGRLGVALTVVCICKKYLLYSLAHKIKKHGKSVIFHLSPVKRICVFKHSVMTNFNCACPAIQRGQGSGFLSEGSSWLTARLGDNISTKFAWRGPFFAELIDWPEIVAAVFEEL